MRLLRGRSSEDDEGMTLVELLVAMAIFSVVLAVFFGGLMTMTRSAVRAQDVTDSGDAVRKAFQMMDKQIRYANSINSPGPGASGAHYVEFLTTSLPGGQEPLCTQWRFDPTARVLQVRTWRDVPTGTRSAWNTIATDVRNDMLGDLAAGIAPNPPFVLERAGGTLTRQQLMVSVDVGRGSAGPGSVTGADVATVFVARNSSYESPSNADLNGDGVSDTFICTSHLERP
ncbi:type II secretion system protein [Actinotalea sp. K2]|uniref:type II secretion system protein n=1 Tax=Actinotalea sp. K2 TaxID=2939438 RepID=UPI002017A26C|nr:type II secretion system protein [Actinotalea sp. K2]MCL3862848.1 type II secretion system GspH family protein [Actinotalea sp. K2]